MLQGVIPENKIQIRGAKEREGLHKIREGEQKRKSCISLITLRNHRRGNSRALEIEKVRWVTTLLKVWEAAFHCEVCRRKGLRSNPTQSYQEKRLRTE